MSESDDEARWKEMLAHAAEIEKAEDEPRKELREAIEAWTDKVAEMRSTPDEELPRLIAEATELGQLVIVSETRLENAMAASQAARNMAMAARPLGRR